MDGRKHSVIEAGGKVFNLRLSYNALALFEDNVGSTEILSGDKVKPFNGLRGLMWAGITDCGGEITIREAGDICEDYVAEHTLEGFQKKMQSIIDDCTWLNGKKGGEKNPKTNPTKQSKK